MIEIRKEMNNECRLFSSYEPKADDHILFLTNTDNSNMRLMFRINGESFTIDELVKRNLPKDIYDLLQCLYADDPELADTLCEYFEKQPAKVIKDICNVK